MGIWPMSSPTAEPPVLRHSPVLRHDSAERVDVAPGQLFAVRGQVGPIVPHGTEQAPRDPVTLSRSEEDRQGRPLLQRRAALVALLEGAFVKRFADLLRAGGKDLVQ